MFIEEIELKGYLRLKLNQFDKINLKFTKKIQLILGTNGSGKSSLLTEMSPLPAEAKNFSKDGHKIMTIKHRGKRYILTSAFNPVNHSFKIEGELDDLNPGGTITVQRELVKKHFSINDLSHSLAIGMNEFHSMPTNARRDWFRLLSDTNYDYAIGVYNRLKEAARDCSGALKLARNKLVAQSSKMMPEEALENLKKDCEELYKIVELFIENRNSPTAPVEETKALLTSTLSETEKLSIHVLNTIQQIEQLLKLGFVKDPKDAASLEFYVTNKLIDIKEKKNILFKENKACLKIVELYEKTKLFQVATISTELEQLKLEKKKLEKSLIYKFEIFDPKRTLKTLDEIDKAITELSVNIPINENSEKYTREKFTILSANKETLKREIDILKLSITTLNERLEHHDDHKDSPDVTCPKCTHTWRPFYNEVAIKELKNKIETSGREIKFKETILADIILQIDAFNHWLSYVEKTKELASKHPVLEHFWTLIMKKEVLFEKPRHISTIVTHFRTYLKSVIEINNIDEKCKAEMDKLSMAENSQGQDHQQAELTIKRISNELSDLAKEELELNATKDVAVKLSSLMKKIVNIENILEDKETEVRNLTIRHVEDIRRIMYNNILRSFQSELAVKEKAINDEKLHESSLTQLKEEIEELEQNTQAYKLIIKELSPTEGIIAEGLFGYIKLFVKQMNKFIGTVWSYPLIVKPCVTEEDKLELNYKFPLVVSSSDAVRKDISEGSSSMREIIDLSFTICALKTIGLGDAQLFLDEFGAKMDAVHRHQTAKMISDISENENFKQIFIISHDVTQYGSLDNAEICVLNSSNVILPVGCTFNNHVVFD